MIDNGLSNGSTLAREIAARLARRVLPTLRDEAEAEALRLRVLANLPKPHQHQRSVLDDATRFRVVACSRRFGKTTLGVIEILRRAIGGARCWWLAPTYAQGQDVWREIKRAARDVRGHPQTYINNSERRFELPGGGVIEVKTSSNPENLRGKGLDFVVLDEAAFMSEAVWGEVVRPMLAQGGGALMLSTPYGHNWFWQVYNRGLDPLEANWSAWHYTIYDAPHIQPDEVESLRRENSERVWNQEYLATFLEDSGAVFRGVDAMMTIEPGGKPQPGRRYVMGVDWGRDNDYTALAVIDAENGAVVALDRFNKIDFIFQRDRLMGLARLWNVSVIWAESNSIGVPNIEALQRLGLPVRAFATTAQSKAPLIEGLALAIEQGSLHLLKDDVLRSELVAYQVERKVSGNYAYGAPSGGHDDTVIAVALAWYAVRNGGMSVIFA